MTTNDTTSSALKMRHGYLSSPGAPCYHFIMAAIVEHLGDGVFSVVYPSADDLSVENLKDLVAPLEEASKSAPITILTEMPPVKMVDPSMIAFGLSTMTSGRLDVRHVGVVTTSIAVRIALRALQTGLKVYGKNLEIATHATRDENLAWGRSRTRG